MFMIKALVRIALAGLLMFGGMSLQNFINDHPRIKTIVDTSIEGVKEMFVSDPPGRVVSMDWNRSLNEPIMLSVEGPPGSIISAKCDFSDGNPKHFPLGEAFIIPETGNAIFKVNPKNFTLNVSDRWFQGSTDFCVYLDGQKIFYKNIPQVFQSVK